MRQLSHLQALEAEAIYIIREVAAECEKPVMLYSIGKDSSVMLHLALKAFYPEKPPFPFMHIDTTWKFKEMIQFRDEVAKKYGLDMIVYSNEEGIKQGIKEKHQHQRRRPEQLFPGTLSHQDTAEQRCAEHKPVSQPSASPYKFCKFSPYRDAVSNHSSPIQTDNTPGRPRPAAPPSR